MCTNCRAFLSRDTDPRFEALASPASGWWVWGRGPLVRMATKMEATLLAKQAEPGARPGSLARWFVVVRELDQLVLVPAADEAAARAVARKECLRRWVPVEVVQGAAVFPGGVCIGQAVEVLTPTDRTTAIMAAVRTMDEALEALGVSAVSKAPGRNLDPNDPGDFAQIVSELARGLHGTTEATEIPALRRVLNGMDVDWRKISRANRDRIVDQSMRFMAEKTYGTAPKIQTTAKVSHERVVAGTRESVSRTLGIDLETAMWSMDPVVTDSVWRLAGHYVTDKAGRWNRLGDELKFDISDMQARGLSSADMAEAIAGRLRGELDRNRTYAEVVAQAWVQDARSYGQLSSYSEAGITYYVVEAILDEATTEECRFLHGKKFLVDKGLEKFAARAGREPQAIKQISPWIRNSGGQLWVPDGSGGRTVLADVKRSGVGTSDDMGEFEQRIPDLDLDTIGIGFPPYHGRCRTTTVAEVASVSAPGPGDRTPAARPAAPPKPPREQKPKQPTGPILDDPKRTGPEVAGAWRERVDRHVQDEMAKWRKANPADAGWPWNEEQQRQKILDRFVAETLKAKPAAECFAKAAESTWVKNCRQWHQYKYHPGHRFARAGGVRAELKDVKTRIRSMTGKLESLIGKPFEQVFLQWEPGRAFYTDPSFPAFANMRVSNLHSNLRKATIMHEYGHHLEVKIPGAHRMCKEWREARTAGESAQRLLDLNPGSNYRPDEVTKPDKFINSYVGKEYTFAGTEVFSMGFEYFQSSAGMRLLWDRDPDHFGLILGILNGGE